MSSAPPSAPSPAARSERGLDWLNFFVADVQTAFGPFIAVDLALHGWGHGAIGSVLTVNAAVALGGQGPAGWLIDWVRAKRLVVAVSLGFTALGGLILALWPRYLPVLISQILTGATGATITVAIAAIALGLVGHRAYSHRVGRNQRFKSLGNAATAAGMGALGQLVSPAAPFFAAAGLCLPATAALSIIRPGDIDYRRARGGEGWYLVGVQVLAGLTAVVVGIMTPLVVADVARGTARYNLLLGAVGTVSGIGAALSTGVSGFVAEAVGFGVSFLALAGVGLLGLAVVWLGLPETAHEALREDVTPGPEPYGQRAET